MKKFVFALEMMSLMLVLPVYMVVELNHPTRSTEKAINVPKNKQTAKQCSPVKAGGNFPNNAIVTAVNEIKPKSAYPLIIEINNKRESLSLITYYPGLILR